MKEIPNSPICNRCNQALVAYYNVENCYYCETCCYIIMVNPSLCKYCNSPILIYPERFQFGKYAQCSNQYCIARKEFKLKDIFLVLT